MKVVITDHRFRDVEQERQAVKDAGGELVVAQTTDEEKLAEACRATDGVITARARITRKIIAAMERCRIIVRYGIGVDTIDIPAATAHGIMVANVPDYCIDEVSDHALSLLLMLSRQMIPAMELAKETTWAIAKMPALHRLRGQICGLFGCGKIGSLLAGKAAALGMKVAVHDPYLSEDRARDMGVSLVSLDELLASSDFISLHAPLNDETHHLFGAENLAKMKPTASLINTARSGLIDEAALVTALGSGKLFGAGLDVADAETATPPMRSALTDHPRVIVTAHTAWLSEEARATLQARAVAQVIACLRGEVPYGLINREVIRRQV